MGTEGISQILVIALAIMLPILLIFVIILVTLWLKNKKVETNIEKGKEVIKDKKEEKKKTKTKSETKLTPTYNKQSIFDFMEFDGVEDNMIIQKNGRRYVMAIECQGVNYDLMSQVEKVGVEEGFQQFLNTLRHPIQIYIQTRTINLEKSILQYRNRVRDIESDYNRRVYEYNRMIQSGTYTKEQLNKAYYEVTKRRNLYEYTKDIVDNTEKMSLNRNILSKKYYIIISYMPQEGSVDTYNKDELRNIAFSELYTKAQALIRAIAACSVSGKILNSSELIELLYVAYNRDDSEVFGLDKAVQAEYYDLYSTAPDVFEKKIKILDEKIREEAVDLANKSIEKVKNKSRMQEIADKKQKDMDNLISEFAKILLQENKATVGVDVANKAIEEIKEEDKKRKEKTEEGGIDNEKGKKTTSRTRKKAN